MRPVLAMANVFSCVLLQTILHGCKVMRMEGKGALCQTTHTCRPHWISVGFRGQSKEIHIHSHQLMFWVVWCKPFQALRLEMSSGNIHIGKSCLCGKHFGEMLQMGLLWFQKKFSDLTRRFQWWLALPPHHQKRTHCNVEGMPCHHFFRMGSPSKSFGMSQVNFALGRQFCPRGLHVLHSSVGGFRVKMPLLCLSLSHLQRFYWRVFGFLSVSGNHGHYQDLFLLESKMGGCHLMKSQCHKKGDSFLILKSFPFLLTVWEVGHRLFWPTAMMKMRAGL